MQKDDENEIVPDEEIVAEEEMREKIKKLRDELKACQSEKGEYLAGWQRAKADFINARKDEEKNRGEFAKYAAEKVLREILKIADSLLARRSLGEGGEDPIYNQLLDILKKEGVVPIEAERLVFNPMYHEALGRIETDKKEEDGLILEELQKGYIIYDRVLRPSKVKVGVLKSDN